METYIRNIVFGCPDPKALATFYAELLGLRILRDDWYVIAKDEAKLPATRLRRRPVGVPRPSVAGSRAPPAAAC